MVFIVRIKVGNEGERVGNKGELIEEERYGPLKTEHAFVANVRGEVATTNFESEFAPIKKTLGRCCGSIKRCINGTNFNFYFVVLCLT